MTIHDLVKLDARIRATLTTINAEGLRLFQRREDLTDKGLRASWEETATRYTPKVESLATEVEEVAAALGRVHDHETEYLLPSGPLTTAQELLLARLLARPGVFDTQTVAAVIGPHLKTPVATALLDEIKARNGEVTDEYVTGLLARSSVMYKEALDDLHVGRAILGVLKQGIQALRTALAYQNVNAAPLDSHNRPGAEMPSLQDMLGPDAKFKIGDDGNTHV